MFKPNDLPYLEKMQIYAWNAGDIVFIFTFYYFLLLKKRHLTARHTSIVSNLCTESYL